MVDASGNPIEVPEWQQIAEKMLGLGHGMMNHVPTRLHEAPLTMAPVIRRLLETHQHLYTINALIEKAGGRLASRQIVAAVLYGRGFGDQLDYGKHWIDECNQLQMWRQKISGGKA